MIGVLPDNWRAAKLSEVCQINPRDKAGLAEDDKVTFVPMAAVSEYSGSIVDPEIRPLREVQKGFTPFQEGDVLFAKITPCMENGKAAIARNLVNKRGYGSTEFHILRPSSLVLAEWIFEIIRTAEFRRAAASSFQGAVGQQRVTGSFLKGFRIPLPPLSEQQRIVRVLGESEKIRSQSVQSELKFKELIPAIFSGIFGELSKNSKGWPTVPISEFVREFEGGKSLPDEGSNVPGRARVLKISAVTSGRFDPTESKSVPSGYEPPADHFVKQGDLLISRANTEELVGATAYVEECPPNILLSDKLWRFVWRNPENISTLFMSAYFRDRYIRYKMSRLATGTGGSMKNIGKTRLLAMRVPLPPFELQKKFEAACGEVRAIQRIMFESNIGRDLSASLLARAFSGELTETWRDRHFTKLEQEARERDAALAVSGVKLSRAPKPADVEAIFTRRTDGAYAELTREQHTVLEAAQQGFGGVKTPRWFTSEQIAKRLSSGLRHNLHAVEAALAVLAARGLLIAVSREDAKPITGEIYYGTAYRLPKESNEH